MAASLPHSMPHSIDGAGNQSMWSEKGLQLVNVPNNVGGSALAGKKHAARCGMGLGKKERLLFSGSTFLH
jgi:hypothetical protein